MPSQLSATRLTAFAVHCSCRAVLLRNRDPHIIRRPHIKTSFMIADVGAHSCVCTGMNVVHFLSPLGEYCPCPFTFLASQSLYEILILLASIPPMLISSIQPALQSGCLLHLFVFCIMLSNRFCPIPSWPCPLTIVIMSLSELVWSSPPLRSSSYQRGSAHSAQALSLLILVSQAHPNPAICFSNSF